MNLPDLHAAALQILDQSPDPVVRYRLLRDVLRKPSSDATLKAARQACNTSKHVQLLRSEQRPDGSWGRFHTMDYGAKQKIGTTEYGVQRAVELGLGSRHPVLRKARKYLEAVLRGEMQMPDRAEKHADWSTGVAMFAGATLSRFAPQATALDDTWEFWSQVVRRSFKKGSHDLDAELLAHRQLLNRSGNPGWLRLRSKHVVMLLGARAGQLPAAVESAYVRWLWEDCPNGLVYVEVPFRASLGQLKASRLSRWLTSLELLAEFPSARTVAQPAIDQLIAARNRDGQWNFGIRPSLTRYSENYRDRHASSHDWSTRVLILLRRFVDAK